MQHFISIPKGTLITDMTMGIVITLPYSLVIMADDAGDTYRWYDEDDEVEYSVLKTDVHRIWR